MVVAVAANPEWEPETEPILPQQRVSKAQNTSVGSSST